MAQHPGGARPAGDAPGFAEFVAIIALQVALTAFSIDIMLVALGDIDATFALSDPNDRQLVITAYLAGFAAGQPFAGPLSDRFGRKPVLAAGILLFVIAALLAAVAPTFEMLLGLRVFQGLGGAAPRVVANAIVRDCFAGRGMARVMSFVMMVFIIIPVIAPTLGAAILVLGPWRWIFAFLAGVGVVALLWSMLRLPETRPRAERLPLSAAALGGALVTVVTTRRTVGYTLALGFIFGGLMTYIGSAQQVFVEVYGLTDLFPLVFGAVASVIAAASLLNARLVERLGMRRLSHLAVLVFVLAGLLLAVLGFPPHPPLVGLMAVLMVQFFCLGLISPNFTALAMEPMGHVAGMASSFIGFFTTGVAAALGWLAGQAFDGTVRPLTMGLAVYGLLALFTVLVTERGRLMEAAS